MISRFDACMPFVLSVEGGNDDDPHDPGGRTSRGIEQQEWDAWRALHPVPSLPDDVWQAPQPDILEIYQVQYWQPWCGQLPAGLDLMFFDTGVNMGVHLAVLFLQHAVHVEADGHFGIVTTHAVQTIKDVKKTVQDIAAQRKNAYRGFKGFRRFGKGWMTRVSRCEALALTMIGCG